MWVADAKKPRAPFAPWDRRELPGIFTVEESARRVGNYKWIEMRLFEVLGGWVATVPELDVKLRLGTHCYHHAWHAELWHKRLPELREMNPERLTAPPNDELVAFVDAMTEPEAPRAHDREAGRRLPGADPGQDRGVHVPPQQHVHDHRRSDDPLAQVRPGQDEFEDWRDGEMMLQSLIETDAELRASHRPPGQARRRLLLAAGGITGPGTIGDSYSRRTRRPTHEEVLPRRGPGP